MQITQTEDGRYTITGGFFPMLISGVKDPEDEAAKAARLLCEHIIRTYGTEGLVNYIERRTRNEVQASL